MRTKTTPKLKYTVKELITSVPKGDYSEELRTLIEKLGVSRASFYRLISIESDSSSSMTTDQLITIAKHFDVSIDELINKEV